MTRGDLKWVRGSTWGGGVRLKASEHSGRERMHSGESCSA